MPEPKKLSISIAGTQISQYRDGVNIDFTFNETLDGGVLIIPALSSKLNIKRNDSVVLTYQTGTNTTESKYFLVAGFYWEFETQNHPQTYTYTITLISATMKLQNDLFPNITITQPITTTGKRTVYWEIDRLNKILGEKYSLSSTLVQNTNETICPEMQWNKRNFWEILNDLLAVVDCVVTMENATTISCISYKEVGSAIPSTNIIDMSYHEDANEYCTELEMNAENVVGDNVSTISQSWITPRSTDYILTTDNAQIILDKPIYYLNKVYLKVTLTNDVKVRYSIINQGQTEQYTTTYTSGTEFLFDITKFVVEEEVYATKIVVSYWGHPFDEFSDDVYEARRYFLKFKTGSNVIDELSYYDTRAFGIAGQYAIYNIIDYSIIEYWRENDAPSDATPYQLDKSNSYPDIRDLLFNVKYVSLNTIRFRTSKQKSNNLNPKVLPSNQGSSYVDAKAIGLSEQANANRIGNPYYEIVLRNYIPSPNDYYEESGNKYYLSQYSLQINNIGDYYCKGQFVKDFIRKNLFTGINSKARWTSIAKESEALLRQDIWKYKFKISNSEGSITTANQFINYIWDSLGNTNNLVALVTTDVQADYFYLPTSCYLLGNNKVIIEFRFQDNVSAGLHIESTSTNAYVCQGTKYVDDNGEFKDVMFALLPISDDTDYVTRGEKYPIAYKNGVKINAFPTNSSIILINNALKDNREIYGVCVDLNIEADDNIIIYDKFYQLLPMVTEESGIDFYVFVSTQNQAIAEKELTDIINGDGRYVIRSGSYIQFDIASFCHDKNITLSDVVSWGLCDANEEKIIECLDTAVGSTKIYINKI